MSSKYILYGWHVSYYTGKVRCYLNYKRIPFIDTQVDMYTLLVRIKARTGAVVMPVLVTPQGTWIQDSSVIIDTLESQFPERSIIPKTPVQRFASYLIEAWGDEYWIPSAMHTRWNYPENYALFEREAGDHLLPYFPKFIKRRAVAFIAKSLRDKLHVVGIRPEQYATIDAWTRRLLDMLNDHFAAHAFLFGNRPTLGDFGLVGTMYAHLGRDPWPARELVAPRVHLRAWIDRMANPDMDPSGDLLADDQIPATIEPVFRAIFAEFTHLLQGILDELSKLGPKFADGRPLPRGLGDVAAPMGNGAIQRSALPYSLWMGQRVLDCYHAMSLDDQAKVRDWADGLGGSAFLNLNIPRLVQKDLRVAFDVSA